MASGQSPFTDETTVPTAGLVERLLTLIENALGVLAGLILAALLAIVLTSVALSNLL